MWCGVVWCGVVWYGVAWCGVVWYGVAWCGVVWCGVVWYRSLRVNVGIQLISDDYRTVLGHGKELFSALLVRVNLILNLQKRCTSL